MSKPTLATLKSFVRKNDGKLLLKVSSKFDGMTDCVEHVSDTFTTAEKTEWSEKHTSHTLGYQGVWLVGQSRDYISPINSNGLVGFHVFNACGSFDVAVREAP